MRGASCCRSDSPGAWSASAPHAMQSSRPRFRALQERRRRARDARAGTRAGPAPRSAPAGRARQAAGLGASSGHAGATAPSVSDEQRTAVCRGDPGTIAAACVSASKERRTGMRSPVLSRRRSAVAGCPSSGLTSSRYADAPERKPAAIPTTGLRRLARAARRAGCRVTLRQADARD